MPNLNKMVDKYKDKDVVFLGLTMNHKQIVETLSQKENLQIHDSSK